MKPQPQAPRHLRLTKDEASILYRALLESKYDLCQLGRHEDENRNIRILNELEYRLGIYSEDGRRQGRKSINNYALTFDRMAEKKN
jgi:hypothetical protein